MKNINNIFTDIKKLFKKYSYSDLEICLYVYMRYGLNNITEQNYNDISKYMSSIPTIFNEDLNIDFDYLMEE